MFRGAVPSPNSVVSRSEAAATVFEVFPGRRIERTQPLCLPQHRHDRFAARLVYDVPPLCLTVLEDARILPFQQVVIDSNGDAVRELTLPHARREERTMDASLHPLIVEGPSTVEPPRRLRGRTLALTSPGGPGYFHFLLEVMTKVSVVETAGVSFDSFDHVLVNSALTPHASDLIKHLGINRRRIVDAQVYPHLLCEELTVPDQCEFGEVPPHLSEWLRRSFGGEAHAGPGERFYIPRSGTAHRRVVNEHEIARVLERHGFRALETDRLSLAQKATTLSSAEYVVGAHGGGMANLLFCTAGAKAIVFNHPTCVTSSIWAAAHVAGVDYAYLVSPGPFDPSSMENTGRSMSDVSPDPGEFEELLHLTMSPIGDC